MDCGANFPIIYTWEAVEKISCPMLILRAEHSVVMSRSTAELMTQKAPNARFKEIAAPGIS